MADINLELETQNIENKKNEYDDYKQSVINSYLNYAESHFIEKNSELKSEKRKMFQTNWSQFIDLITDSLSNNERLSGVSDKIQQLIEKENAKEMEKNTNEEFIEKMYNDYQDRKGASMQLDKDFDTAYGNIYSKIFGYLLGCAGILFLIYKINASPVVTQPIQKGGGSEFEFNEDAFKQCIYAIVFAFLFMLIAIILKKVFKATDKKKSVKKPLDIETKQINLSVVDSEKANYGSVNLETYPTLLYALSPKFIQDNFRIGELVILSFGLIGTLLFLYFNANIVVLGGIVTITLVSFGLYRFAILNAEKARELINNKINGEVEEDDDNDIDYESKVNTNFMKQQNQAESDRLKRREDVKKIGEDLKGWILALLLFVALGVFTFSGIYAFDKIKVLYNILIKNYFS